MRVFFLRDRVKTRTLRKGIKNMTKNKRAVTLGMLVGLVSVLMACEPYSGGHGPGWGWDHGGWHHGSPYYPGHPGHPGGGYHGSHPGGGHPGGGHPGGGHHHFNIESSAEALASDFSIRSESALALLKATSGQIEDQQIGALGLESSDLMALAQLQMPSRDGIEKVAKALNEDPEKIERIADSFVTDVKAQMQSESSEYWQGCIGSGHWSTPQNSNCKQTYWNGCAPSTGATSCEIVE